MPFLQLLLKVQCTSRVNILMFDTGQTGQFNLPKGKFFCNFLPAIMNHKKMPVDKVYNLQCKIN